MTVNGLLNHLHGRKAGLFEGRNGFPEVREPRERREENAQLRKTTRLLNSTGSKARKFELAFLDTHMKLYILYYILYILYYYIFYCS